MIYATRLVGLSEHNGSISIDVAGARGKLRREDNLPFKTSAMLGMRLVSGGVLLDMMIGSCKAVSLLFPR